MIKTVISMITLCLATFAIFLGVRGGYAVMAARLDAGVPNIESVSRNAGPDVEATGSRPINVDVITNRNLFKTTTETVATATEPQKNDATEAAELEKTKLKLKLWGTVTGPDQMAFAIIEDAAEKRQNLFRVGESLKTAMVKQILRERVVLTVNGKDEALDIEKLVKPQAGGSPSTPPGTEEQTEPPPESAQQEDPGQPAQDVTLGKEQVEGAIQNVNELMKQVRIRPHFTNGQPDGLSLSGIKPGSVFQDIGLRSGDVILGVDGQPIQSVDDALKFYTSLKDAQNVSLQIRREGQEETIKYSVK
jgi:general secretion pathway protein C